MRRIGLAARLGVSALALAMVAWRTDVHAVAVTARSANLPWVALALAINLAAVAGSTMLWRIMLQPGDRRPFAAMLRAYFIGLFYNNAGFGTAIGDASRGAMLLGEGTRAGRAAMSVMAERIVSCLALLGLASAGAVYLAPAHRAPAIAVWSIALCTLSVVCAAWLCAGRFRLPARVPSRLRGAADDAARAAADLIRDPTRVARAGATAVGVQLCTVAAAFCVLRALGTPISPVEALAVFPMIALFVLMPVSVQGIGVREATYVYGCSLIGIADEHALSAALLSYVTTLLVSLVGAALLLRGALAHEPVPETALSRAA